MPSLKMSGVIVLAVAVLSTFPLHAQGEALDPAEGYLAPPAAVQNILNRDAHYATLNRPGPDGQHFLVPVQRYFSTLELMGRKTYRLGMLEIVPDANREWRLSTYGDGGFRIFSMRSRRTWNIDAPDGVLVSDPVFSPDGSQLAFLVHLEQGSQVWTAQVGTGRARALSRFYVMATLAGRPQRFGPGSGSSRPPSRLLQWMPDGSILTLLVPAERGPEPDDPDVPRSPIIRHTREKATPTPTYPFLLGTPHDQDLFRYYTTAQIAVLAAGREPRRIGEPGMYMELSLSPDGKHILAEKIVEPFSYIVSYNSFPRELEVLNLEGEVLSTIRKVPLQEGAVIRQGQRRPTEDLPRDVAWRPDGKGLSLLWREKKEDPGDEEEEQGSRGERADRLMFLAPPFDMDQIRTLASSKKAFTAVSYSEDGHYAFSTLTGRGEGTRNLHDIVVYDLTADPPVEKILVGDIDPRKIYELPGRIMTRQSANGTPYTLVSSDGGSVYLQGDGLREDFRPRPFVDRLSLEDGSRERVFESSEEMFEDPLVALDSDLSRMIVSRESLADFPNSYLRADDGTFERLTDNRNPFPEVEGARRIDFEFQRRDGLTAYGRLTLPPGYREGTRLPAVFWTYPREYPNFKEYKRAAVRSRNQKRYKHLNYRNSSEIWLTQGYAVVEPDIPIIGRGNTYNDNYIAHLVDSMYAAIRKVDRMGYIDVDRLGHGGHSYGAFATANILARSPFFKAGIAGDGAFNRTLTPMTFQRERRFFWEAADTILEMSPFFQADHLDTPLLMYHGAVDNNTGTFLIQSERLMQALTGLGKTAVLYIYPFESHGPRAKETYMDLWSRWIEWFDKYVKGEVPEEITDQ